MDWLITTERTTCTNERWLEERERERNSKTNTREPNEIYKRKTFDANLLPIELKM